MPEIKAEGINPEHIEAVHACHQICLLTLKNCLRKGGDHVERHHLTHLMDCAEICRLHEDFLLRGSHHHAAICEACEKVCEECAESCETYKGDQEMAACAQACRRCAEVCRMM